MSSLPISIPGSLTGKNEWAQELAERVGADLITGLSDELRQTIKIVIVDSIKQGWTAAQVAQLVRQLVGMNASQAASAVRYRATLVKAGHSEARIHALMETYTARKVRQRGETIARTEIMGALNTGQLEKWLEAQRRGLLGPNAKKRWNTVPSELKPQPCKICAPLNKVAVPLAQPFPNGKQCPPGHPRCRCTMQPVP